MSATVPLETPHLLLLPLTLADAAQVQAIFPQWAILENVASRRISEKQGMRRTAVVEKAYVCGTLPAEIWEITADEWRARRAQRQKLLVRDSL